VASGRSSPPAEKVPTSEERNWEGQPEVNVPEMAVSGCRDTHTQGSTDSANRNAEIKPDGDEGTAVGPVHSPHTERNPSLRSQNSISWPGGTELGIAPGSSNNTQTQENSPISNRNTECQLEEYGLGITVGVYKDVGTRKSSHPINRNGENHPDGNGGGMVISHGGIAHVGKNDVTTNRDGVSQPEGDELRIAPGNYNNTHTGTSSGPANAEGQPVDDEPEQGMTPKATNTYVRKRALVQKTGIQRVSKRIIEGEWESAETGTHPLGRTTLQQTEMP